MKLIVAREYFTDKSTEGELFVDNEPECYTLEDKDRELEKGINEKVYGETAIPRGSYKVVITYSNHFKRYLPELLDVPGFEGIRIHSGNKPDDTEGCILVGSVNTSDTDNWVGSSKTSFDKLFKKIKTALDSGEKVYITVT